MDSYHLSVAFDFEALSCICISFHISATLLQVHIMLVPCIVKACCLATLQHSCMDAADSTCHQRSSKKHHQLFTICLSTLLPAWLFMHTCLEKWPCPKFFLYIDECTKMYMRRVFVHFMHHSMECTAGSLMPTSWAKAVHSCCGIWKR